MSNRWIAVATGIAAVSLASIAGAQSSPRASEQPLARTQFIADMDNEFRKMDADKNGRLTRIEIEQYQKLSAVAQAEARNRALFAQLDADKSGQLNKAEFAKLVTAPPAANAQPMLSRMDGNRDQQISLVEHRTATVSNFDRLDTDKDGVVSPVEMKAGGIASR